MKITVESTTKIVPLKCGGDARIWEGFTESGIPVYCYIVSIAVPEDTNLREFERELKKMKEPSAAVEGISMRIEAISMRMIL